MKRIYIAGPVTGIPDENRKAFYSEAAKVRERGDIPIVPHDYIGPGSSWQHAMRVYVAILSGCDGIRLLPGWNDSKGARLEASIAFELGITLEGEIGGVFDVLA